MTQQRKDVEIDRVVRASLAEAPLPAALAARVHARARTAFEGGGAGPRRAAGLAAAAAVVSAVAVYLTWAIRFLNALASG